MALDQRVVVVDAVQPELERRRPGRDRCRERVAVERARLGERDPVGQAERARRARAPGRARPGRCRRGARVRRGGRRATSNRYGAGPAARSAMSGPGAEDAAAASARASRASTRISRKACAGASREQPPVDLAPERGPPARLVAVHVVHERAGVEPVLVADAQALAHERARARCGGQGANRQARGERARKVALELGEDAACALSVPVGIQRRLGELAHAGTARGRSPAAAEPDSSTSSRRFAIARSLSARTSASVAASAGDSAIRHTPRADRRSARASRARRRASRRCRAASLDRSPHPPAGTRSRSGSTPCAIARSRNSRA